MNSNSPYDEEYYERGLVTGKSCYMNYIWMPELTLKMVFNIIKYLDLKNGDKVLDYGCAKGFLVKALRILDIDAYGCDISEYAIDNVEPEVRHYCSIVSPNSEITFKDIKFDWIITKDVLEHMEEKCVDEFLTSSIKISNKSFHVIPLGSSYKYIVPEYNMDSTHILAKSSVWWREKFESFGWKQTSFSYRVRGIKDNWTDRYPYGNGFFVLEKK